MPVKPSDAEEEYFAREQMELKRKLAAEHQAHVAKEDREREKALHFMKCPKCGSPLEEVECGSSIKVDKCFTCEGIFLDKGEMEAIQEREPSITRRYLRMLLP